MRIFKIISTHTYEDVKDGKTKNKYFWAGTMRETDNGARYIRMHDNPSAQLFCVEMEFPQQEASESMEGVH